MKENNPLVCVIDDESEIQESLSFLLRSVGLKAQAFSSAQEFLTNPPLEPPGCLVVDVQLPGISGLDLQQELARSNAQIPIIFVTGHGDIPTSVRAIKAGAIEFLTKPVNDEDLLRAIGQAINFDNQIGHSRIQSAQKLPYPDDDLPSEITFSGIVGRSAALRRMLKDVDTIAPTSATILICGETGTGKELIVDAIHQRSRRNGKPLVRVNCSSIPKELFESEFFGHVKGSFTGAIRDRLGRFEAAEGGTLFLDEVGEIPLQLQSKLLRVLQEKSYERVGEERMRHADVRIIAATNRDLKKGVAEGRFREDLYYRLNVFQLKVAPLRDRLEDIPLLAKHFVESSVKEFRCPKPRLTEAGIKALQGYDWPGNIRELRNVIERTVIFAQGGAMDFDVPAFGSSVDLTSLAPRDVDETEPGYLTDTEIRRREHQNLFAVLEKAGWKVKGAGGAAELLGVSPTTLFARMQKIGLKRPASTQNAWNR
ncbi:MAG: sigma-54-dependent Fis family transcriptional regulator [Verrucomicrobia bacterium]|nr:sigma-54-dependent Fis family transcriptional regulator [Verrucomicrobiota bacterium]MBV8481967.1 sigma-54-dependent Fis family transcriptional regulator [Verrucomicrobiota bacterium]